MTFPSIFHYLWYRYEAGPKDGAHGNSYVYSTFIQPSISRNDSQRAGLVKFMMDFVNPPAEDATLACTGTLIGGRREGQGKGGRER